MQQPIEHRADCGDIAQQFAPVLDRTIGCEQRAEAFVAAHDDLQQILGGGMREFAHAEVVDDEQRHGGHRFHVFFARAVGDGVGQFIEQDVRFAIQHSVALLDRSWPMACARWLLPVPPGPRNKASSRLLMKAPVARSKTRLRFIFGLKAEVEVIERPVGIAKAGLFAAAFEQTVGAAREFVGNQTGDQVDGRHGFGLSLAQAGFEHRGHAAQPELASARSSSMRFMIGSP